MMKIFALLFLCSLAIAKDLRNDIYNPKVNSPAGIFQGSILKTQLEKEIFAFRGIRYAEAPTGEKRFKAPIKAAPYQGIYDATQEGAICPQSDAGDFFTSEDCLYLNVYTTELPQNSTDGSSKDDPNRPVFVFIHGGGFASSSGSSQHYGPQILLDANIVLVTINYRLGALGFLSSGDSRAPGNAGLKDQVLALEWVQDNVKAFGGNPNEVTMIGQGAGSACVSLHIVSPMSKGLLHRAVMMGGAAVYQYPLQSPRDDLMRKTAEKIGCPVDKADDMFNCLYTKPSEEFVTATKELTNIYRSIIPIYQPVIEQSTSENKENVFLNDQPINIISQRKANFVPFIAGVTKHEFEFFVIPAEEAAQQGNTTLFDEFNNNWNEIAPKYFSYESGLPNSSYISGELKEFYMKNGTFKAGNYQGLAQFYSDALINYHMHKFERLMATYSPEPVYYYKNVHENCDTFAKWSNGTRYGVVHNDPQFILFVVNGPTKHCDRNFAIDALNVGLLSYFGSFGNPTPENKNGTYSVVWQPSTKDHPKYLEYNGQEYKMVDGVVYPERMAVWDRLFPW